MRWWTRTPASVRWWRRQTAGDGPGAAGAGCAKRVMAPNLGSRKYRPAHPRHGRAGCASASRPSGPHANIVRHPPRADSWPRRLPRPRASPSARRRSRRRSTGGGRRNGRRHRAARSALWPPDSTGLGHPEVIASAQLHRTGVQAARRRPGEVAARTDRLRTNNGRGRLRCRRNWPPASGCARGAPRAARRCSSAASRPAAAGAAIRRGAWAHGLKTPGGCRAIARRVAGVEYSDATISRHPPKCVAFVDKVLQRVQRRLIQGQLTGARCSPCARRPR